MSKKWKCKICDTKFAVRKDEVVCDRGDCPIEKLDAELSFKEKQPTMINVIQERETKDTTFENQQNWLGIE